jgi:hypothetical protein
MYVCGREEEKKKAGDTWVVGKNKKEKRNGEWVYVYGGKKWGVEKKEEKNLKGKKLIWFYLYVHFVWCKV